MQIKLVNKSESHKYVIGDIFKTINGNIRMIILTSQSYHTISLDGQRHLHDTSIGLLMQQYNKAKFMGRLEITG